jgi:polyisoprenoid-binding protein YceI
MRTKFTLFALLMSFGILKAQSDWNIDKSHTNIKFTVTHMVVSEIDGEFRDFTAFVKNAGEDFNGAEVEFTAQTASIDTNHEGRDKDLRSENFFDVEKFPAMTFKGKIQKEGSKYFIVGDFTMKDVTKQVKFDVRYNGKIDSGRGMKAGFKVIASINRFDYNLKWNRAVEAGGLVVGEEVIITCNIELNEARG